MAARPRPARTYAALPEPPDYARFQKHVADAMDDAAALLEPVALRVAGNPDASRALVTMATIGETALELLADDDDLLLVRVHAYRPFPGERLVDLLAGKQVTVVDRAAAFGSLGPLGLDVKSLLPATNVLCGIGGTEVTPETLRHALAERGREPVWEGI